MRFMGFFAVAALAISTPVVGQSVMCDAAGDGSNTADSWIDPASSEPFEIQIERVADAIQGMHVVVDVTVNRGVDRLAGFDLLISYDRTGVSFSSASAGDIYGCGWEYFTFRTGPFGACGSGCPGGMVRVVGLAETNNGPHHPNFNCADDLEHPFTLFTLDFLVTDDRTFECQSIPIRFFWMDCGDNSLAYYTPDNLYNAIQGVSRNIYEPGRDPMSQISDPSVGFPTYAGVQAECLQGGGPGKPAPIQFVDFVNGGVDIICADSIDVRGDVNLNGQPHEIADAVLFSNYFVYGLSVFTVNMAGQIAATDVTADGLTLTVADLVYLIRIVLGDAPPYSKLSPVSARVTIDDDVIAVDAPMGAAYLVAQGSVAPELLAPQMDLAYNFDGLNTHILVWSSRRGAAFEGPFLAVRAPILTLELATYEGARVELSSRPCEFRLDQNYPNPFNPTTTIAFSLPQAADFELSIMNVMGQVVYRISGAGRAGTNEVVWNASSMASGVYFYELRSEGRSETRKMLLLK